MARDEFFWNEQEAYHALRDRISCWGCGQPITGDVEHVSPLSGLPDGPFSYEYHPECAQALRVERRTT